MNIQMTAAERLNECAKVSDNIFVINLETKKKHCVLLCIYIFVSALQIHET
jgi:hypothetical protein